MPVTKQRPSAHLLDINEKSPEWLTSQSHVHSQNKTQSSCSSSDDSLKAEVPAGIHGNLGRYDDDAGRA